MGRKGALTEAEKLKVTQRLHNNLSILEIAKEFSRDHRTVKNHGRSDNGKFGSKHLFHIEL